MNNVFELIAKFRMNNKNYMIILINKTKILCITYYDNRLHTELTEEEYLDCKKIYESLLVNKQNSICVGMQSVNNTIYKIYYDINKENYFWEAEEDKSFNSVEDNIILNFRYNHIPEIMFNDLKTEKDTKNNGKYYNKFVKIGHKVIAIALAAGLSLGILSGTIFANNRLENENGKVKTSINSQSIDKEIEYNYEDIKQAISSNKNLGEDEKEFLYKLEFVFEENHQYMDLELIIERLKSLKITYDSKPKAGTASASTIGGLYSSNRNEIYLFGVRDFNGCNISTFLHEIFHVLQAKHSSRYTMELSNEFFTRETLRRMKESGLIDEKHFADETDGFDRYGNGYQTHMFMYYALAEMMKEEELREYQFTCNEWIIIKALNRTDDGRNSVEKAYGVLEGLDSLREYKKKEKIRTPKGNIEEQEKECVARINYFYKRLKGIPLENDLMIMIHRTYYTEDIHDIIEKTLIENIDSSINGTHTPMLGSYIAIPRTYLSDSHKNSHIRFKSPEVVVDIIVDGKVCAEYITNYDEYFRQMDQAR